MSKNKPRRFLETFVFFMIVTYAIAACGTLPVTLVICFTAMSVPWFCKMIHFRLRHVGAYQTFALLSVITLSLLCIENRIVVLIDLARHNGFSKEFFEANGLHRLETEAVDVWAERFVHESWMMFLLFLSSIGLALSNILGWEIDQNGETRVAEKSNQSGSDQVGRR